MIPCKSLSVPYLATGEWSFGIPVCEFAATFMQSLANVSAFNIMLMALNRYYKVVIASKCYAVVKSRNILTTALLT